MDAMMARKYQAMPETRLRPWRLLALVAVAALTLGVGLGESSRLTYHKAFVAQAAREMIATGEVLVPQGGGGKSPDGGGARPRGRGASLARKAAARHLARRADLKGRRRRRPGGRA